MLKCIFFSARGSETSSFNDGTKLKNIDPTLGATTSIIFSAVVVLEAFECFEQILSSSHLD